MRWERLAQTLQTHMFIYMLSTTFYKSFGLWKVSYYIRKVNETLENIGLDAQIFSNSQHLCQPSVNCLNINKMIFQLLQIINR
jgi:hypothetical protein